MGCEPQDLQRMLKKRSTERKSLRTVKADPTNDDNCFRLVWGSFATRAEAEEAIDDVPPKLVEEGFQPHVVEVTEDESDGQMGTEG
jgi:septal ring-binding cell division protein DamX